MPVASLLLPTTGGSGRTDIYGYPRPRIMDKWTYNRGKSYFMLVLTFEDGFLIRVERGSKYGF